MFQNTIEPMPTQKGSYHDPEEADRLPASRFPPPPPLSRVTPQTCLAQAANEKFV